MRKSSLTVDLAIKSFLETYKTKNGARPGQSIEQRILYGQDTESTSLIFEKPMT